MLWLVVLLTMVTSALLTRITMSAAALYRFVDQPGTQAHKQHRRAVPYGGGAAMTASMALAVPIALLFLEPASRAASPFLRGPGWMAIAGGAAGMFALGLFDDLRPMRARGKFLVQAFICAVVVWIANFHIDSLRAWPVAAYGLAWLWLMLVTNAYNLLDHADGLSACVAAISAAVLLSGCLMVDDLPLALVWLQLIAVLAGFLVWNLPPARIYMGDAGSLPLGFLIGAGTLSVTFWPSGQSGSPLALLTPVLITAIPLFDTAVVMVKRARRGKPLMQGDRNHISHRLVRLGMGPRASLATVVALQLALAAGTLQLRSEELLPGLVVVAQSAGILLAVVLLETTRDGE